MPNSRPVPQDSLCAQSRIKIEEQLFARRRDLFSELSVVFMDITSVSFTGAGGATLGDRGYSKDHRPDLMQLIVAVVVVLLLGVIRPFQRNQAVAVAAKLRNCRLE
jgi:hypothetical protein